MCGKLFLYMFFALLLPAALGAEQQYLVSETQLRNLEMSAQKSEQDRQNWQQQARGLKNEAGALNSEAVELRNGSEALNAQLRKEREQYRTLRTSFSKYAASQLKEKNETAAKIARLETAGKFKDKLLVFAGTALLLAIAVPLVFRRLRR
jgi:chromosome segregation ATPase